MNTKKEKQAVKVSLGVLICNFFNDNNYFPVEILCIYISVCVYFVDVQLSLFFFYVINAILAVSF